MTLRKWLDVAGLEGRYQVSDDGYVRSLPDIDERGRFMPGNILKAHPNDAGYPVVQIAGSTVRVHRLVAQAFIPNPDQLPEVNHKNGIKSDARAVNLEWCSRSENHKHRYAVLGQVGGMTGKRGVKCANSKQVRGTPVGGGTPLYFGSAAEAQRITGIHASGIGMAARGQLRSFKGHLWQYISREEFERVVR